jgi:hypothetical protein
MTQEENKRNLTKEIVRQMYKDKIIGGMNSRCSSDV